jgi:hypothetical protein
MEASSVDVIPPKGKEEGKDSPRRTTGGENDSFINHDFLVKNTTFENKVDSLFVLFVCSCFFTKNPQRVSFCVQSFDGPCPLLAMANVLLLRNKLRIKPGADRLTTQHVLTLVGDEIVSRLEKHGGVENDLESCLNELRKLQSGLQINVSFAGLATAFEPSTGLRLFELLDVKARKERRKKKLVSCV